MKRRSAQSDSFELLLDTVTNAFGGILFLAILIILLVNRQTSVPDSVPVDAPQSLTNANQVKNLQSQISLLEVSIQVQRESLENLTQNDLEGDYAKVAQLQQLLVELQASRESNVSSNQSLIDDLEKLKQQDHELRFQIESEKEMQASLQQELAKRKLPQVRTALTPRLRETRKREFPMLLRYGRIYCPYTHDGSRNSRLFNSDDFIMLSNTINLASVTPKPYRGKAVIDAADLKEYLKTAFKYMDKDLDYIAIATWDDSFAEFNELRNAIVAIGFEYRIIPVESGGFIQEGALGQSFVQ